FRMSQVILQCVNARFVANLAVLSGPSFALEAAAGQPTAVVIAAPDAALAAFLQEEFSGPTFRLYTNDDVPGVELAGAMKNVMAIAAGACQGLGLG
ncbi:glycerol-3-phosphate dehydrogenase, partial [Pseudomonas sp. GW460-12]